MGKLAPKPIPPRAFFPPGMLERLESEFMRPAENAPLRERFYALDHNRTVIVQRCSTVGPSDLARAQAVAQISGLLPEAALEYVKYLRKGAAW